MENKCLLDTELFDFFCQQFGEIKSHEIPASAVTLLKNNAKDNTPVNDTKVFNILKAYNQCVAQQHSTKYCYKTYNVLTTSPNFSANDNYKRSAQEILDNITKYSTTTTLRNMIEIVGDFNEGFIAINYLTQEQILCDIEWHLYVCAETESIPAETSYETIFHVQTNIIEGNEYKIECIIRDREYASHWCWTENIIWMKQANQIIYPSTLIHAANEIPMKAIYPDTVSDENQYFYITTKYKAFETTFTVALNNVSMYYSITDPYHWQSFTSSTLTNVKLEENTKIYFKTILNLQEYNTDASVISFHNNSFIKTTGGNIMSLVYGDNFKNETSVNSNYCNLFAELFSNCSSLKTAKHLILPIEYVPEYGYTYMFGSCSSLVYAPEKISATKLENDACENMFSNCTSLIYAPEILAVRAYDYAMKAMFNNCTSLKYVPDLHIMFCGEDTCEQMFAGCTSLERAPKIPILTLTNCCCDGMFSGCENLKYIDAAFMDAPSSSTNGSWVQDVSATGTFVKNVNADWNEADVRGDDGVPTGWTVITAKPDREFEYMVEYIATDGNAYIDTGVIQSTHKNEFIMSAPTVTNINFFGSQTSSSSGYFILSYNYTTGNKWTLTYGKASVTNSTTLTANIKYKISGAKTLTITNLSSNSSFTLTGSGRPFASTYSTYLFAVNNAGTPILSGCNGLRCYRAKITNDSTLIVDYVPVCIGSKGYMYNRVTKSLVKNAGSGNFTPGPAIIPVEYLGSNGQAYIDIPITINYDAGISISTELIPVYTSSYTNSSIFTVGATGPNTLPSSNGVNVYYKSYSNNIITYSSSIAGVSTNGDFMMQVGKHENLILSTLRVISSHTYAESSRSLVGGSTTTNLRLFAGYPSSGTPQGYPIKICNFNVNITIANQYYAILTPVKLNNVGYMYDTISGELYGNIGSSSFTFGPEVFINITP